jgi:hypothetical protein
MRNVDHHMFENLELNNFIQKGGNHLNDEAREEKMHQIEAHIQEKKKANKENSKKKKWSMVQYSGAFQAELSSNQAVFGGKNGKFRLGVAKGPTPVGAGGGSNKNKGRRNTCFSDFQLPESMQVNGFEEEDRGEGYAIGGQVPQKDFFARRKSRNINLAGQALQRRGFKRYSMIV